MKHLRFLAAVCCMLAVFTACEKNEPNDNTNGNGINTDQNGGNSNTDNSSGSVSAPTGTENGHGYVDLGLPSGLKWATCNVGATKPEEYGNYYAWGETEPKTTYDWNTYKWATATYDAEYGRWEYETLTKYNTYSYDGTEDNKTVLDLEDDAAAVNWGGQWRMPTWEECQELIDNCTWTWTGNYNGTGVAGQILKSKINGNSIFIPAAGFRTDDDFHTDDGLINAGYRGDYWSSSLTSGSSGYAWLVIFYDDEGYRQSHNRYWGCPVRPVLGE